MCFLKAWDLQLDLFSISLGVCRWCSQSKAKNYLTVTTSISYFFLKIKNITCFCVVFKQFIQEAGRTLWQTGSGHHLTLKNKKGEWTVSAFHWTWEPLSHCICSWLKDYTLAFYSIFKMCLQDWEIFMASLNGKRKTRELVQKNLL